jgi:hypothetical protein
VARFAIRVDGLDECLKALLKFTPTLYRASRRRLRDRVARPVADAARASAASWSVKIPPGISYGSDLRGPYVKYRGSAPTIGRLAENRGTWRHPLFGDRRHWYVQSAPAFLVPAVRAADSMIEAEMIAAVEEAALEVGLA